MMMSHKGGKFTLLAPFVGTLLTLQPLKLNPPPFKSTQLK